MEVGPAWEDAEGNASISFGHLGIFGWIRL
jgi:hypothetical protein